MTETKFTPGPWSVPHFAREEIKCDCRYLLAEYGGMGSIATISVCDEMEMPWGDDNGPNLDQAKANAHLIAAAPELYEALKAFIGWEQYIRDDLHEWCSHDITGESIEALNKFEADLAAAKLSLAKARGES